MIQNVAVIGAGVAGRAFALRCAGAGLPVALEDVMPEKLRRAQDAFGELPVRYALTVEDAVADADLAIDFVPDELESKLEIFSLLDRMCPPRTILLTPTNVLSITDLASCTYRPERCVGVRMHGDLMWNVIRGGATSDESMELVKAMLARLDLLAGVEPDRIEPMLTRNLR